MIVTVTFDSKCVASQNDIVSKFLSACNAGFEEPLHVSSKESSTCSFSLDTNVPAHRVEKQVRSILGLMLGDKIAGENCTVTVTEEPKSDYDSTLKALQALLNGDTSKAPEAPKSDEPLPEPAVESEKPAEAPQPTILDRINERVGSKSFKALCQEIHLRAPLIRKNKTQQFFLSEAYLVAADSGCGFNSAMDLFGRLLVEEGIMPECSDPRTIALPAPQEHQLEEEMEKVMRALDHSLDNPRVLAFDISDWKDDTNMSLFKDLLMRVFRQNKKCVIFFRVPYMGKIALEQLRQDLDDIISTRILPLEPFTVEELRVLGTQSLQSSGYAIAADAWEAYDRLMTEEKRNGLFYGVHTVQKVSHELIRAMELHCAQTGETGPAIPLSVISSLLPEATPIEDAGMEELRSMIGMEAIAERVQEIINQIIFARSNALDNIPAMHMCFVGNPGTGKTTVARVIGKALKDAGILRIGNFYEHHGRDFCGKYVGHTAPLTKSICEKAYGSILFVDEAYSLSAGSDRDFGQEAVTTLIAEMENHKDDLVVIFAGYPEDIGYLLDSNSGMRSRVPFTLSFPNYTPDQLTQIFLQMASRHFTLEDGFAAHAEDYFRAIPESVLNSKSFGNARFARNLYERVWSKAAMRDSSVAIRDLVLTCADFDVAAAEFPMEDTSFKKNPVGFSL